ncbi:MAG: ankyrin repeat domain-containing protein [Flavobacteriales bacterium]|nr:ankyrin repeat domain-containing protein [Flavobacteriales bacterium]
MKRSILLFGCMVLMAQQLMAGSTDDLFKAIKTHDMALMEKALGKKADVNALDKNGSPVLNSAIIWPEMTQKLIEAGANVNNAGKVDMTPLMTAAMMSIPESMKLLLDAGADPKFAMKNGMSILHYATWRSNCAECVSLLVKAGANVNDKDKNGETPLTIMMTASTPEDRAKTIGYTANAYKAGGFTELPKKFTSGDANDWDSPADIMKVLIEGGADPNAANVVGTTPLITAAFFNKVELMRMLIDAGADVSQKERTGVSPLSYAARNENMEAIDLLLEKGADINERFTDWDPVYATNVKDYTILSYAVMKNQIEVVKKFLNKGAKCDVDVHGRYYSPLTGCFTVLKNKKPLFFAIENNNLEMVKLLVETCNIAKGDPSYIMTVDQKQKKYTEELGNVTVTHTSCYTDGVYTPAGYAGKLGFKDIESYLRSGGFQ